MLKSGEVFLAACDAFAGNLPHPEPLRSGRRRQPVASTSSEQRVQLQAEARFRLASVRTVLGMHDEEFADVPRSRNGFMLTHTDRRMMIFDGSGRKYQLQAPIQGLWLQPIDHGGHMYTLVFNNGEERVALSTRRESFELTEHFIASFPDRRQQTRVLTVPNEPAFIDF